MFFRIFFLFFFWFFSVLLESFFALSQAKPGISALAAGRRLIVAFLARKIPWCWQRTPRRRSAHLTVFICVPTPFTFLNYNSENYKCANSALVLRFFLP